MNCVHCTKKNQNKRKGTRKIEMLRRQGKKSGKTTISTLSSSKLLSCIR